VRDQSNRTHTPYVTVGSAVAIWTYLQCEKPLSEIEDQETKHGQCKDFSAGPAALARSLNGFRQQVEERGTQQDTRSETEQQVDMTAGVKSKPATD